MPRPIPPPPPPRHWTAGRIGKLIGYGAIGAVGVAAVGVGVFSLVVAPIAAIPWFIAGALAIGLSSYKVIQTATKTERVAAEIFHRDSDENVRAADPDLALLMNDIKDNSGILESKMVDEAFFAGKSEVEYFFEGFVPLAGQGHNLSREVYLEENVPFRLLDVFEKDLRRMEHRLEGEDLSDFKKKPEDFINHLLDRGMSDKEIEQMMHIANQEPPHVGLSKLQILYAQIYNVNVSEVRVGISNFSVNISDPTKKPVGIKLECDYKVQLINLRDVEKSQEVAQGKFAINVPDITNQDIEARDAILQITETSRKAL